MGDRLRKARELVGLSTQEFADEIGVSRGTINNAESGNHRPRLITLKAYAMRTGVPLSWLETGQTPARPEPDGGKWAHRGSNSEPAGLSFLRIATAAA